MHKHQRCRVDRTAVSLDFLFGQPLRYCRSTTNRFEILRLVQEHGIIRRIFEKLVEPTRILIQ